MRCFGSPTLRLRVCRALWVWMGLSVFWIRGQAFYGSSRNPTMPSGRAQDKRAKFQGNQAGIACEETQLWKESSVSGTYRGFQM